MPGHPQSLKFIKKFCQLFLEGGSLFWADVQGVLPNLWGPGPPPPLPRWKRKGKELQHQATKCFGFVAFAIWQSSFGF